MQIRICETILLVDLFRTRNLVALQQLCFILALFYDKKCCNYFNFVPCILWDFIVLSLVLS